MFILEPTPGSLPNVLLTMFFPAPPNPVNALIMSNKPVALAPTFAGGNGATRSCALDLPLAVPAPNRRPNPIGISANKSIGNLRMPGQSAT